MSYRLENIGFYTLSNERARTVSVFSPLQRCEMILTDRCNFRCPYCRGLREDVSGTMEFSEASRIVKYWISQGLKNIRFSGGEPTLYKRLDELVKMCRDGGVERVAISTNGSMKFSVYEELMIAGVNDFSISLDACCSAVGDKMAGIAGSWGKVVENIRKIAKFSYVTVGMVFTEENIGDCINAVMFADSLGVSDIRVIPSAQYNEALLKLSTLSEDVLQKYPILRYRIENVRKGRHVRGITKSDCNKCPLVLDDMAVAGGKHFPCIIYMREGGDPIGWVNQNTRADRLKWFLETDTYKDPICRANCLDVCIDHNNATCHTNPFVKLSEEIRNG